MALEKISTLSDMKDLMKELMRLEAKFLYEFYGALQDFTSKKFLPQWLQNKSINKVFVSEKGKEVLSKVSSSPKRSVIFYDLETQDLNGLQFLAELGQKPDLKARCKIVLAAPNLTPDAQSKLMQMGVNVIISKPLEADKLRIAFEKIGLDY
ncbi:MAG: response regulator [Fibromonadales bacterium]|nr:response regulator [Fibromonadales bacterium]